MNFAKEIRASKTFLHSNQFSFVDELSSYGG